ncbi:hypothetical protein MMJ63_22050, partial [Bacillus vallismortis]|nr:hypothetical protein [Bacillus vallismortis]
LNGDVTLEQVFSYNGIAIVVVNERNISTTFSISNPVWELSAVADTNGKPGAELIVKAGNHAQVIHYAGKFVR